MSDEWNRRVKNTFIHVGPVRSPSLDDFYRERRSTSCPDRVLDDDYCPELTTNRLPARTGDGCKHIKAGVCKVRVRSPLQASAPDTGGTVDVNVEDSQDEYVRDNAFAIDVYPKGTREDVDTTDGTVLVQAHPKEDLKGSALVFDAFPKGSRIEIGFEIKATVEVDVGMQAPKYKVDQQSPRRSRQTHRAFAPVVSTLAFPRLCVFLSLFFFTCTLWIFTFALLRGLEFTPGSAPPPAWQPDASQGWRFVNAIIGEKKNKDAEPSKCPAPQPLVADLDIDAQEDENYAAQMQRVSYDEFQAVMNDILRLVPRFEELRSKIDPSNGEARRLKERLDDLVAGMRQASIAGASVLRAAGGAGLPALRKDLEDFLARAEGWPGILDKADGSPMSHGYIAGGIAATTTHAPLGEPPQTASQSRAKAVHNSNLQKAITPATFERVSNAMQRIVDSVGRFKSLHAHMRNLPNERRRELAKRKAQLDRDLFLLEERGDQLEDGGTKMMSEVDGETYAAQLEGFLKRHRFFVKEAEKMPREGSPVPTQNAWSSR